MRFFYSFLLAVSLFPVTLAGKGQAIVTTYDVTYGNVNNLNLKLDMARPNSPSIHPGIVFIHGGGWRGGCRSLYDRAMRAMARRGYFAATISYRLSSSEPSQGSKDCAAEFRVGAHSPSQIEDVRTAIRFLRLHATDFSIDSNRIVATGHSAGGNLALLAAATSDPAARANAAFSMSAPTDLIISLYDFPGAHDAVESLLGGSPNDRMDQAVAMSPVYQFTHPVPPLYVFHRSEDMTVPVSQAYDLQDRLESLGANNFIFDIRPGNHSPLTFEEHMNLLTQLMQSLQ